MLHINLTSLTLCPNFFDKLVETIWFDFQPYIGHVSSSCVKSCEYFGVQVEMIRNLGYKDAQYKSELDEKLLQIEDRSRVN